MILVQGIAKVYVFLFACAYTTTFTTIQGFERQKRSSSTQENGQGSSYFYFQHPDYPRDCKDVRDRCSTSLGKSSATYLIKPEGYMEPFEVYCNNEIDSGGWTVVLRRSDGSLNFKRNWENYKVGFGFLSYEHWLGNEKLSYLTNQAQYEIRIDFVLSNGSSFYVKYNSFRISDEWSQYVHVSSGTYGGNASLAVSDCPPNMVYGNLTCQLTCDDPKGSNICSGLKSVEAEACVCADGFLKKGDYCVLPAECACFVMDADLVIPNNETYVNSVCSKKCTCQNDRLICSYNYECSANAECRVENDVRQCYCNEDYGGDGETCIPLYKDCYDAHEAGQRQNGVYTILPAGWIGSAFDVYCDMTISGGGWTVFQRRTDGVTNFYRNWASYRNGFGSVQHGSDFWLGNEQLYYLTNTNQRSYKLRIDIVTSQGTPKHDVYASFRIASENTKYRLVDLGSRSGTAGNGMQYCSGHMFSTHDSDYDQCGNHNCAMGHRGAWWYYPSDLRSSNRCTNCDRNTHCDQFTYNSDGCNTVCSASNLNGDYAGAKGKNIYYGFSTNCNLRSAEMKIRPS